MRLLATADIHYNHPKSRRLADELIDQMNAQGGDAVLVVGDAAVADGDSLERCLERFRFPRRMFVAGNHELWTAGDDSHRLHTIDLPRRVRGIGWDWLEGSPAIIGSTAFVGSVGWYDYSLAADHLKIPKRFYEHKISPGSAAAREGFEHLLGDDIPPAARNIFARWNDGQFVKLGRSDEAFLEELIAQLDRDLQSVATASRIVAGIHHLPFRELMPPTRGSQWDFARAFLGSEKIGHTLLKYPSVTHILCGHTHWPMDAQVGHIRAINIGTGYRWKTHVVVDLPD